MRSVQSMTINHLPLYLQDSIRDWLENKDDPYHWNMYSDDLYGSINAAQHSGNITEEKADNLRLKYLGIDKNQNLPF